MSKAICGRPEINLFEPSYLTEHVFLFVVMVWSAGSCETAEQDVGIRDTPPMPPDDIEEPAPIPARKLPGEGRVSRQCFLKIHARAPLARSRGTAALRSSRECQKVAKFYVAELRGPDQSVRAGVERLFPVAKIYPAG